MAKPRVFLASLSALDISVIADYRRRLGAVVLDVRSGKGRSRPPSHAACTVAFDAYYANCPGLINVHASQITRPELLSPEGAQTYIDRVRVKSDCFIIVGGNEECVGAHLAICGILLAGLGYEVAPLCEGAGVQ